MPGLVPFGCARRIACAPKDMRRAKGVLGVLRAGPSSSSMALSSMESEPAVETLPRLALKGNGEVWLLGEAPERPSVEMDMRRRWSWAPVLMALGKGAVGAPVTLLDLAPKMEVKVCWVKEPRRFRAWPSAGELSLADIFGDREVGGDLGVWVWIP